MKKIYCDLIYQNLFILNKSSYLQPKNTFYTPFSISKIGKKYETFIQPQNNGDRYFPRRFIPRGFFPAVFSPLGLFSAGIFPAKKTQCGRQFWNAVEREPVETRVLNPTASEAS